MALSPRVLFSGSPEGIGRQLDLGATMKQRMMSAWRDLAMPAVRRRQHFLHRLVRALYQSPLILQLIVP